MIALNGIYPHTCKAIVEKNGVKVIESGNLVVMEYVTNPNGEIVETRLGFAVCDPTDIDSLKASGLGVNIYSPKIYTSFDVVVEPPNKNDMVKIALLKQEDEE